MLCLKTETLEPDMTSHGEVLRLNFNSTIHRLFMRSGKTSIQSNRSLFSSEGSENSSAVEDSSTSYGTKGQRVSRKMCFYRSQLEREVQNLQKRLQEEIYLHIALADALENTTKSACCYQLPDKAHQLLANIEMLEMTVLKLEEELVKLHFQLSQERNERRLAEYRLKQMSSPKSSSSPTCSHDFIEQCISPSRVSRHSGVRMVDLLLQDLSDGPRHSKLVTTDRQCFSREEDTEPCVRNNDDKKLEIAVPQMYGLKQLEKDFLVEDLSHHPNKLSEEMVRCMRNIFLCLADSSNITSKFHSSEDVASPCSPCGILSSSSLASFSDLSVKPSLFRSFSCESRYSCEELAAANTFDPYRVSEKLSWAKIGSYSSALEVSWMSVGKKQLKYAAEALKGFRLRVEQLVKVNPTKMSQNERMAFWINLYNALIMHAYLAYGVPKSEIKFFSLLQKVSYTVGGHSFSAADIEYNILKMKPPAHRPQIALVLALHKFKMSDELKTYSIDKPDPMVAFALSCGTHSSPAVRIFRPDSIVEQLDDSLKDYIRASVGISSKGKLLVPKLLHSYAKGIVEDSLLADWICRFLSSEQAAIIRECTSQRKQRLLGARSFAIIPFDSRFRYLFLPDDKYQLCSSDASTL